MTPARWSGGAVEGTPSRGLWHGGASCVLARPRLNRAMAHARPTDWRSGRSTQPSPLGAAGWVTARLRLRLGGRSLVRNHPGRRRPRLICTARHRRPGPRRGHSVASSQRVSRAPSVDQSRPRCHTLGLRQAVDRRSSRNSQCVAKISQESARRSRSHQRRAHWTSACGRGAVDAGREPGRCSGVRSRQ